MNRTRYIIQHPSGEILDNILEITELWAWAVLYRRQHRDRENTSAGMVPPDWIQGVKDVGYRTIEITLPTEAHAPLS